MSKQSTGVYLFTFVAEAWGEYGIMTQIYYSDGGVMMKFFIVLAMALTSLSSFANSHSFSCYEEGDANGRRSAILCRDVKSAKDSAIVQKCYRESTLDGDISAVLCSGVRSEKDIYNVFTCYYDSTENPERAATLCSGIKNLKEVKNIMKCYNDAPANGDRSAVLCSKNGVGAVLFPE